MNSCVLMAQIIQQPELRYTADNQLEITQMLVQFWGARDNDPPANLKVVSFGKLAKEIQQNYKEGDQVILVGRLTMNVIERPEGFKEKRAEMTAQQIQHLGAGFDTNMMQAQPAQTMSPVGQTAPTVNSVPSVPAAAPARNPVPATPQSIPQPEPVAQPTSYEPSTYPAMVEEEIPEDDIPF
ncbi:single-strand binding protein/primosomal replication protein n [Calothrix parasitica NIES-267]|uniref:Single-strand binding protein/primosomal replication protein n n=1 Tax=Calothrix parasitica NIES-267 TaxID=1973488 RepID=A0A1Z4LQZ7_9CYAN|nr:single-strand binding protein/primosomal replication protein n [Calothrix parasitica NIES-267]